MAVTKRVRYEVLRRDNHTCRYCGGTAPDVVLTVDHVTPVALGGSDDPKNLVTACKDCNAGKASTSPDGPLVEDVKRSDFQWAGAIIRVAAARASEIEAQTVYVDRFDTAWRKWRDYRGDDIERPPNWRTSLERFHAAGLPVEEVEKLVRVSCGNDRIARDEVFRYFAGCCWRSVTELQDAAKALLEAEAVDGA